MSLPILQLASTSALLAGSASAPPIAFDESALLRGSSCAPPPRMSRTASECGVGDDDELMSQRLALGQSWKTKRTVSDVLTGLLDVEGVQVVAERHVWNMPDNLVLRHDFASDTPLHLYCAAGLDRTVYLDSRALNPSSGMLARRERSVGMMAEAGASWRLTGKVNVESDIRWMDVSGDARLMRTDAGWVSGDPVALTLSLVWRGK